MVNIKKEDVTFILKVGEIEHDTEGAIKGVNFVYRGDYSDYNWGFKLHHVFTADSSKPEFTPLGDVTKQQVSKWIENDLSKVPDIDIESLRMNPDQDLTGVRLPSPIESLQIQITNEIKGFMKDSSVKLKTATLSN